MRLYYLISEYGLGERVETFLWAASLEEAKRIWMADWESPLPPDDCYEIPLTPPAQPGAISWEDLKV
jgi:hypothetical protein